MAPPLVLQAEQGVMLLHNYKLTVYLHKQEYVDEVIVQLWERVQLWQHERMPPLYSFN